MLRALLTWTLGIALALGGRYIEAQDDAALRLWLTRDSRSGGPGPSLLEATINAFPGSSLPHRVYIWAKLEPPHANAPTGDFTSIGLNLRVTSPGATNVLDLTRVELDNPLLDSVGGINTYRYQFVVDSTEDAFTPCVADPITGVPQCAVVVPCTDTVSGDCGLVTPPLTVPPEDFLAGFGGLSIDLSFLGRKGVGIGDQARMYADPTFDGENWRIGWFEFVPLESGAAQVYLQVGRPGIGRRGASEPPLVYFGHSGEAPVPGNEIFAQSAEADAQLTIRLMPDYNRNGAVDTADYVVWRDTLGSADDLRADGSGNGLVDGADYELWKRFFGTIDVPGDTAVTLTSVPEPPAVALVIAASACFSRTRRCRRAR